MSLDPGLLAVLACPCPRHASVTPDDAAAPTAIVCDWCATSFPVSGGIPVMLLSEAAPGPAGIGAARDGSGEARAGEDTAGEDTAGQGSAGESGDL